MIIISTTTGDINGHVSINTNIDIRDNIARVSRVKTLDGGAVVDNSGFSYSDITVNISTRISESQAATLWYIFKTYTAILLSTNAGLFLAAIKRLKTNNGALDMTILIESRED